MKKWLISLVLTGMAHGAFAQYIPAQTPGGEQKPAMPYEYWHAGNTFQHLDLSVSVGTTGIGIDLATPLCKFLQLRAGYDYMPHFKATISPHVIVGGQAAPQYDSNGYRVETPFDRVADRIWATSGYNMNERVDVTGKLTMQNLKVMLDLFPFKKKNWHFTAGLYWGPKHIIDVKNAQESATTLMCIGLYNQMYEDLAPTDPIYGYGKIVFNAGEYARNIIKNGLLAHGKGEAYELVPDINGEIRIEGTASRFKPYFGFGYTGRLIRYRNDWKVSFECGALFWGGSPTMTVHDGINLTEDIENIPGKAGTYMDIIKILKVYPQLSVRLTKTLF